jgi:hypothetical protein
MDRPPPQVHGEEGAPVRVRERVKETPQSRKAVVLGVFTDRAEHARPRREPRPHPAQIPFRFPERQRSIPRSSRRRSPEAPAGARRTPQGDGWKALLAPVIPADPRPDRRDQDRPVTPEVAGSSPVAPVKDLQICIFCCRCGCKRPPASFHPAQIPHKNRPQIAARSRP